MKWWRSIEGGATYCQPEVRGVTLSDRADECSISNMTTLRGQILATLVENGALISPGASVATFDPSVELKRLRDSETRFDDSHDLSIFDSEWESTFESDSPARGIPVPAAKSD
jgi:hypothetical protein